MELAGIRKKEALKEYKSQSHIWEIFLEKRPEVLGTEYFVRLF